MEDNMKSISQKTRFEIFKRDNFVCQYCGKTPPEVILEVDHIIPKSKRGTNDLINLLTSCRECNRGKTNNLIDNKLCREDIDSINNDLFEKKLQLKQYYKFLEKQNQQIEKDILEISDYWYKLSDNRYKFGEKEKSSIRRFLQHFTKYKIMDAIDVSLKVRDPFYRIKYFYKVMWNWIKGEHYE